MFRKLCEIRKMLHAELDQAILGQYGFVKGCSCIENYVKNKIIN